ncbi:islet cell autoantigen 1-like protein isoform X1 [Bufo gargarizans]|uniref:islet cell autoantigen 1-like protein isoform X1 n=1 Tax=Bufo gargarizans TaxID=30331 RepID=UPI001CF29028|nr:islet cell autoantigen 1-like protein isoform X1 [Bufo gargarizans]
MYSNGQLWAGEDRSMVSRMQKKFWETKQVLIKVTGKKEDEHVVASDAELDVKLEIFHSIQTTGSELLKIIEKYHQALNALSLEENDFGLHLKVHAQQNSTRAGKMMKVTGNALSSSAGQRLALCAPLSRLQQEMDTFTNRAVSDTLLTINQMEKARTEYRGALLWMKDVSQELDPDTYKQMEKFRKVQIQVRNTKSHFDKTKMNVCQKVDLLGASRCNLLSQSLASYQTTLLHFWKKTAQLMSEIQKEFQEMLPYTPSYLKAPKQNSEHDNVEKTDSCGDGQVDNHMLLTLQEETLNQEAISDNMNSNLFDLEDPEETNTQTEPRQLLLDNIEGEDFDQEFSFLSLQPTMSPTFSQEEQDIFECGQSKTWTKQTESLSGFLPSQLLDLGLQSVGGLSNWTFPGLSSNGSKSGGSLQKTPDPPTQIPNAGNSDMSAWLNMFADLDPLASLGATGHSDNELFSA